MIIDLDLPANVFPRIMEGPTIYADCTGVA
jgi:hypothetical protein